MSNNFILVLVTNNTMKESIFMKNLKLSFRQKGLQSIFTHDVKKTSSYTI